jgi:hypothetical protein
MPIPTIVIQRSCSELGTSITSGDQVFAHVVERTMASEVFGYERGYLAREPSVIDGTHPQYIVFGVEVNAR